MIKLYLAFLIILQVKDLDQIAYTISYNLSIALLIASTHDHSNWYLIFKTYAKHNLISGNDSISTDAQSTKWIVDEAVGSGVVDYERGRERRNGRT